MCISLTFLVLYELNRLLRNFALCFHPSEVPKREMINIALEEIIQNILSAESNLDIGERIAIEYGEETYELNAVTVSVDKVSLHHPLHYFLALCVAGSMTNKAHSPSDWEFIQNSAGNAGIAFDDVICRVFLESCIQHFSLVSQIKAGFWVYSFLTLLKVRNGNSVLSQASIFAKIPLQECVGEF
jgi:hypothetical protein